MKHGRPGTYTTGGCRCEPCTLANREKQRAYYNTPAGKAVHQKMARKKRAAKRLWLDRLKASWCLDCGYVGPPEAMDFDHRPDEAKAFGLADKVRDGTSRKRMAQEVLKCDLVCANCHRIRTVQRQREAIAA